MITQLIPKAIKRRLLEKFRSDERAVREAETAKFPRTYLQEKHMRNCQLVLNRSKLLERLGKQNVVAELGVNRGEFSEEILAVTQPSLLHLVDIWESARYDKSLFTEVSLKFKKQIEDDRVRIHKKPSIEAAVDFPDDYFDVIYIDTDHSYQTTRGELLAYAPKLKSGGVIAGHDYKMGNWKKSYRYGVIEAVHEFCNMHNWELCYLTCEPLESQSFAIRRIQN
ncbi:MAG: class I SAM-dependent methyltransferase [Verrucomicrobia bacterium]|nr:class I SAM-dependent methyltransferase [Verrucomicrobiota bacterium]MDA1067239.1 class I SAM-dependent methyltransferase [Verrucomicrobiota bacterium]